MDTYLPYLMIVALAGLTLLYRTDAKHSVTALADLLDDQKEKEGERLAAVMKCVSQLQVNVHQHYKLLDERNADMLARAIQNEHEAIAMMLNSKPQKQTRAKAQEQRIPPRAVMNGRINQNSTHENAEGNLSL